jgi:uncharacterized membrane protein YjgN (DUF898 family)
VPLLLVWLILAPLVCALAVLLGLALLVWMDACWRQLAAGVRRPMVWLAHQGLPLEYAIPTGLALLPMGLVTWALLR